MACIHVFRDKRPSFANKVADSLKSRTRVIEVPAKKPERMMECDDEMVLVLDVVQNLTEPEMAETSLRTRPMISDHDFSLALLFRSMQDRGMEKSVKLIGIPPHGNTKSVAEKVLTLADRGKGNL